MPYLDVEFVGAESVGVLDQNDRNPGQLFGDWRDVIDSRPHDSPLISSDEQFTHRTPHRREIVSKESSGLTVTWLEYFDRVPGT